MNITASQGSNFQMEMICSSRVTVWEYSFRDQTDPNQEDVFAVANMDGSWWVDWDQLQRCVAHLEKSPHDVNSATILAPLRLLLHARGHLIEVSRERADEIAMEYGAGELSS